MKTNKKYYPQTLLEEWKYEIRKNERENLINDDLEPSSPDESESDGESNIGSDSESNV